MAGPLSIAATERKINTQKLPSISKRLQSLGFAATANFIITPLIPANLRKYKYHLS